MDIRLISIVVIVILAISLQSYFMLRLYKKCGPNEAMIITGAVPGGIQVVCRGGAIVWPLVTQMHSLSLEIMTIEVLSEAALITKSGLPIYILGLAHVKVGDDDQSIIQAAERFLSKSVDAITTVAHEVLLGRLRAIVATMTVEEITQGLEPLTQRVRETANADLAKMGLFLEFFTVKEIRETPVISIPSGKRA